MVDCHRKYNKSIVNADLR